MENLLKDMLSHPLSYKIKFTYGEKSSYVSYICAVNAAESLPFPPQKEENRPYTYPTF